MTPRQAALSAVALTLACLVAGPAHPGGITKPKGGQSAVRHRKATPPHVAE